MNSQIEIAKNAIENVAWKRHQRAIDFHVSHGSSLFEAENKASKMVAGDLKELIKTWEGNNHVINFIKGLITGFSS